MWAWALIVSLRILLAAFIASRARTADQACIRVLARQKCATIRSRPGPCIPCGTTPASPAWQRPGKGHAVSAARSGPGPPPQNREAGGAGESRHVPNPWCLAAWRQPAVRCNSPRPRHPSTPHATFFSQFSTLTTMAPGTIKFGAPAKGAAAQSPLCGSPCSTQTLLAV